MMKNQYSIAINSLIKFFLLNKTVAWAGFIRHTVLRCLNDFSN